MRKFCYFPLVIMLVCMLCNVQAMSATLTDSESASHSDEAASYQVQAVYEGTDLKIVQFNLAVLSHFSYLLISDGKALVIDPGRDVQTYLDYVSREKLEWEGTLLTHSHADFIAGHREMALATGRPIYTSHSAGAEYAHVELREGSIIEVGKAQIRIIETPGHTPDSLCGIVVPAALPDKQEFLFSGDTLFVGSLGRPDLMGGQYAAAELASMMFDTWNNKLSKLNDNVIVLPAHGAGSLCGANLGDSPSTSIGEEKKSNYYLKYTTDRSAFIAKFLTGLDPAPQYFGENARINRIGPELINWGAVTGARIDDLGSIIDNPAVYLVDIRSEKAYAAAHIAKSVNISLRGRLETWTGIIVPFNSRLVLIGSSSEIAEASRRLKRVGYSADFIEFDAYRQADGKVVTTSLVTAAELYQKMLRGEAPVVVDVRRPVEWLGMKIGEVLNIPLDQLEKQAPGRLIRNEPVIAVCNSAFRSSLAIGLLERAGFSSATSMEGGSEAWLEAGYPVIKIENVTTAAQAVEGSRPAVSSFRNLGLPERITAAQLQLMIRDLPNTFEIVDIRPFEQVEDYNPTGARAVEIGDLIESQSWLAGTVPLVIVDRDGTLAMMAAGIISRRTGRPIKVLIGGIEEYWRATEMKFTPDRLIIPSLSPVSPDEETSGDRPAIAPVDSGETPPVQQTPPAPVVPQAKPVRKGAGC